MPYRAAVVLGASMSGLLAVRALGRHFEHVTLVDRDVLPAAEAARKGVPQSAHAHGLLASGYRVMDEYFPGMMDELADGEPPRRRRRRFLVVPVRSLEASPRCGLRGITVSRPCPEGGDPPAV